MLDWGWAVVGAGIFVVSALVLAACGGDEEEKAFLPTLTPAPEAAATAQVTPTLTPVSTSPTAAPVETATAAPTATPVPPPAEGSGREGFRAFADDIDHALAELDVDFFMERAVFVELVCEKEDLLEEFNPCQRFAEVGRLLRGMMVGYEASEGTLFEVDELREHLATFMEGAQPQEMDAFGGGAARVYALSFDRLGCATAVVTAIVSGQQLGPHRELRHLSFCFEDGRWRWRGMLVNMGVFIEDILGDPESRGWEVR